MIEEALARYTEFYADLREQGASPLTAHADALWWALEEIGGYFSLDHDTANTIRDLALERRQKAGEL